MGAMPTSELVVMSGRIFKVALLTRRAMRERLTDEAWIADIGFRPPCIGVLRTVAHRQPVSQREVSDQLDIDPSDTVAAVDILERAGFVTRERDPKDRRRHALTVTTDGQRAADRFAVITAEAEETLLAPLTDDERQTLQRLLDKIVAGAEAST
jgi:DNA-binding MarR family transcriptional regulator